MKKHITTIALFLLAATVSFAQIDRSKQPQPGPAPKINLGSPETFQLGNGLTVMVVENHKLPRVTMNLTIDNAPILEGDKAGVSSLTGSMMGNGTKNMAKDAYNERIDFLGANVSFGSSGAFASCLSKYFPEILNLMADGLLNPVFSQEEFDKQKEQLLTGLKSQEKDVSAISERVTNALAYGTNHPYGEFVTEETVNNITLKDVESFYSTYFAPKNAYLVIVGDVNVNETKKLVKDAFVSWKKGLAPQVTFTAPKNAPYSQINFVDVPNAVQSEIKVVNNIDLKMSDPNYFKALIANHILGGSFNSYLNMNLREARGFTYGARSGVNADRYGAGLFEASASVRNAVTDSAVVEFMKEINRIRTEKVSDEDLKNAKAKYLGNFVLALENPQTIARYALNIKTQNLPADFYQTYLEKINAVTADDVKQVANTYFAANNARIVVTGKGSEVLEGLEKVELNGKPAIVTYYDKYAKNSEKPNYQAVLPEGTNVQSIINKYFDAIGGQTVINNIESLVLVYEGTAMGSTITSEEKRVSDKISQTTSMNGNPMMSIVAKGNELFMKQGGNKIPLPENMQKDLESTIGIFPEQKLISNPMAKVTGIEKVEGKNAYKIEVPGEAISATYFYDTETGFKVKEVSVTNMNGQSQTQEAILKEYVEVDGVKFPSIKIGAMGPQTIEMKLKEAIINKGVTAEDFD